MVAFMAKHKRNIKRNEQAANSHGNPQSFGRGGGFSGYGFPTSTSQNTTYNVAAQAGYPDVVGFDQLWLMATKNPLGKAGIHRLVNKCWQSHPTITDGEDNGKRAKTQFERDLDVLIIKHKLFTRLRGCDWRQRVGRYSAMLPIIRELGDNDADKEITKVTSIEALIKLVPKFESEVDVTDVNTESDISSPDYGNPTHFNLREGVRGDRNPITNEQIQLHPSRVITYAEGADDGSIFGIPALEAGFNDLINLESIGASAAITMKKNAQQRVITSIKDNQVATVISDPNSPQFKAFSQNMDDFDKGVKNSLVLYGMEVHALNTTLADPTNPFTIALTSFAASVETPVSELVGLQMNEQASASNRASFNETAKSRRENFINPEMILHTLNYLIDVGVMAKPTNEIIIKWDDLNEDTPSEKLDTANKMEDINKKRFEAGRKEPLFSDEEVRVAAGHDPEPEGDIEEFEEGGEPSGLEE
jgi:hypothetical protein